MIDWEQRDRIELKRSWNDKILAEQIRHEEELQRLRAGIHEILAKCTHEYEDGKTARPGNSCYICCKMFLIPAVTKLAHGP